jgi:hypothetical protein
MANYSLYVPCNSSWRFHSHHQWHSNIPLVPFNHLHSHCKIWQQHTGNIHPDNVTIHYHPPIDTHLSPITDVATTSDIYSSSTTTQPPAQPLVMTAATCRQHMHWWLHLILLSFYPHPVTLTSSYWCGTFLICYYAWCSLLLTQSIFLHILLTFLFPYLRSYSHATNI